MFAVESRVDALASIGGNPVRLYILLLARVELPKVVIGIQSPFLFKLSQLNLVLLMVATWYTRFLLLVSQDYEDLSSHHHQPLRPTKGNIRKRDSIINLASHVRGLMLIGGDPAWLTFLEESKQLPTVVSGISNSL